MADSNKIQPREALDASGPSTRTHGTSEHKAGHQGKAEATRAFTKEAKRIRMEVHPPQGLKPKGG